jgi:hypothetical protein
LTPDEIYELAQQASSGRATNARDAPSASSDAVEPMDATPIESFRQIVERVTEVLAADMRLPAFAEWAAAYRERPSRYDEELLGFWKEAGR